jgi:hypothetical protein
MCTGIVKAGHLKTLADATNLTSDKGYYRKLAALDFWTEEVPMFCPRPLCGVVFGPLALSAGGAAFLGTLAALALAACAAAEPGRPRGEDGAERPAGEAEPTGRGRRRARAL